MSRGMTVVVAGKWAQCVGLHLKGHMEGQHDVSLGNVGMSGILVDWLSKWIMVGYAEGDRVKC